MVTYLANTLSVGEGDCAKKIPYSTITGVDSIAGLGPLLDEAGQPIVLADDEIVLNRWAADDLRCEGRRHDHRDVLRAGEHARPAARTRAAATIQAEGDRRAGKRPTASRRPPPIRSSRRSCPGVTDQESINDWDLPFELVETIRQQDEDYWDEYRTTPKAFVSLATAKRLWPSRWGTISLLRIPADGEAASAAGM